MAKQAKPQPQEDDAPQVEVEVEGRGDVPPVPELQPPELPSYSGADDDDIEDIEAKLTMAERALDAAILEWRGRIRELYTRAWSRCGPEFRLKRWHAWVDEAVAAGVLTFNRKALDRDEIPEGFCGEPFGR